MKNYKKSKQTNGKLWTNEPGVDETLESEILKHYKTNNAADYETELRGLNTMDLHIHAASVCVTPRENKEVLIGNLIKEFKLKFNK